MPAANSNFASRLDLPKLNVNDDDDDGAFQTRFYHLWSSTFAWEKKYYRHWFCETISRQTVFCCCSTLKIIKLISAVVQRSHQFVVCAVYADLCFYENCFNDMVFNARAKKWRINQAYQRCIKFLWRASTNRKEFCNLIHRAEEYIARSSMTTQ